MEADPRRRRRPAPPDRPRRGRTASPPPTLPLREIKPLEQPKIPEPVGLSREQYAALLQVPAFDPSRVEVGGTHLWHLIDDPKTLHRFLKLGIHTWGSSRRWAASTATCW